MNEQQMTEAMARLDGLCFDYTGKCRNVKGTIVCLPDYPHDYNAVHRVLNGLDRIIQWRYYDLIRIVTTDGDVKDKAKCELTLSALLATPAQMREAILRATGLWVDSQNNEEEVRP